jgi:phage-related protein
MILYQASGLQAFVNGAIAVFKFLYTTISLTVQMIYAVIRAIFLAIVSWAVPYITAFANGVAKIWYGIVSVTISVFGAVKNAFVTIWTSIVAFISPIVASIWNFISASWNKIKNTTTSVFGAVKTFFVSIWSGMVAFISPIVSAIANFVSTSWNKIKSTTSSIFGAVKSTISSIWNGIKSTISSVASGIWSAVSSTFGRIKSAMTKPIEDAKSSISSMLGKIKGFFTGLVLKIPAPKMPHISVSRGEGTFLGQKIPYPKFNVSWNATGNIFDGASILGGGQGVGEAGAEAVIPIERKRYLLPFSSSIAEQLNDMKGNDSKGNVTNQFSIAQLVVREEADVQRIAQELERIQKKQSRATGFAY